MALAKYTIVPRGAYPFHRVDALSRYAFGLIYDRFRLSNREETQHKWTDKHGVYCVFDRADLARELGVSLPTLRRCMDVLVEQGLIVMRRNGPHAAWRYYPTARAHLYMECSAADIANAIESYRRSIHEDDVE